MQLIDIKERPMLFSAPMVRAILRDAEPKTQTRRVMKPQPDENGRWTPSELAQHPEDYGFRNPYGKRGDRLYVRETWAHNTTPTGWPYHYRATSHEDLSPADGPWKPSIHMPRKASRIILEITNLRVECLQEISEKDAIAEGIKRNLWLPETAFLNYTAKDWSCSSAKRSFRSLWILINGVDSWNLNPWVWVVEFKKVEQG